MTNCTIRAQANASEENLVVQRLEQPRGIYIWLTPVRVRSRFQAQKVTAKTVEEFLRDI